MDAKDSNRRLREIVDRYLQARENGSGITADELVAENPDLESRLRDEFKKIDQILAAKLAAEASRSTPASNGSTKKTGLEVRCPNCHAPVEVAKDLSFYAIQCESCGGTYSLIRDERDELFAGTQVGRFTLTHKLGSGGFGTVWAAHDPDLDRYVALKLPRYARTPAEQQQFLQEAQSVAQLNHPNIVKVHEVGTSEEGIFIASELIDGKALSVALATGGFTIAESVRLCENVASALHHAHQNGIIHRDLKPANVLLDQSGNPFLSDFGLARRESNDVTMTASGQIVGTPSYMSPQQANGEPVDRRTDVYSLGVVLFELLTGDTPFKGSSPQAISKKVLENEPVRPRSLNDRIGRDLETICLKCLEKDPRLRYATAQEVEDEFRRFREGRPIRARPIGMSARGWRWGKRNPRIAAMAIGLIGTVVIGLFLASRLVTERALSQADRYHVFASDARQATVSRIPGYGEVVEKNLAQSVTYAKRNRIEHELQEIAVASFGDFVAQRPIVELSDFGKHLVQQANGEEEIVANAAVSLDFDAATQSAAIGLMDGTVRVFDAASGEFTSHRTHDCSVLGVAFVGDSIVSISSDGLIVQRPFGDRGGTARSHQLQVNDAMLSASFSSDRKRLAVHSRDQAWLFDIQTFRRSGHFPLPSDAPSLVNIAVSNHFLAVGFDDGDMGLHVFGLESDSRMGRTLNLGGTYPHGLSFSNDGAYLAMGCEKTLVFSLSIDDDQLATAYGSQKDEIMSVAFSPDSHYLATVSIRGEVEIRNFQTQEPICKFKGRREYDRIGFDRTGKYLFAHQPNAVDVWQFDTAERQRLFAHRGPVPTLAFLDSAPWSAKGGPSLVTGSKDRSIRIRKDSQRQDILTDGGVQSIAVGSVGIVAVAMFGLSDGQPNIQLFRATDFAPIGGFQSSFTSLHHLAFNSDCTRLCVCGIEGVEFWNLEIEPNNEKVVAQRLERLDDATEPANANPRNGNRSYAVHGVWSKQLAIWARIREPRMISVWKPGDDKVRDLTDVPIRRGGGWHGVLVQPETDNIMFVTDEGTLQVWNVKDDKAGPTIGQSGDFDGPHLALHSDGRLLAGLARHDQIAIWNLKSGERLMKLRPEESAIWSMSWSNEKELAVGLSDGGVFVWDIANILEKLDNLGIPISSSMNP